MMKQPYLVIMAAGMGSRYGGMKQVDPVDSEGHIIIDFSLFDAYQAGFRKVVFIIKPEMEQDFRDTIGARIGRLMQVEYVFQKIDALPAGFSVPENRRKPWGTGHAVLSCAEVVDAPFAVINADDYYGRAAFEAIYSFLSCAEDTDRYHYAMVGYQLENTLTDFGSVARGVCEVSDDNRLISVTERTRIEKTESGAAYTENNGCSWTTLPKNSIVSMNLWGFTPSILTELETGFPSFLTQVLQSDPIKGEYFLPSVVSGLIAQDKADVTVLYSPDKWYGVTYKEDKQCVVEAVAAMKAAGFYPNKLWESL